MAPSKYEARATDALRALKHRNKLKLQDVADRAGIPGSSMSRVYNGRQPVTLRMLDAIEQITGDSALEMLIDPMVDLKAVTPPEAEMLRYFRSWPSPTRSAFLMFVSFFADAPTETHDQRRAHEQLRRLPDAAKRRAYAYLTFLSEGGLTPDLQEAFGLLDSSGPRSERSEKPTRRTPKRKT